MLCFLEKIGKVTKAFFYGGGYMENNIKEAIKLLESNRYFVAKIPEDKDLCSNARECMETGHGECMDCSCFVCLCGGDM